MDLSCLLCYLCAIVITVESINSDLIVDWTRSSVSRSTAAVASSRTSTYNELNRIKDFLFKYSGLNDVVGLALQGFCRLGPSTLP